ncbi:unnamed protein product [Urochloa decumbens]|uniref:Pectinesterase inhibitor domain-containing protein n=1 Tax=Urochloa decumbens TaxID=240449 RepID=A0ABC9DTL5_9POAL
MVAATTTTSVVALLFAAAFLTVATHAVDIEHHQGKPPQYKTSDLVTNSCANMRAHDWIPQFTRKRCESTLRSDKQSVVAKDERDLALISMNLLQSSVAKVDSILRQHSDSGHHSSSTTLSIRYCRLDYAAVARTVPMCRAMVQEYVAVPGDPTAGDDFYDCIARLGNAAANCWDYVLADDELAKVVSKAVGEVFQRATLVRAMVEVMIGFRHDSS